MVRLNPLILKNICNFFRGLLLAILFLIFWMVVLLDCRIFEHGIGKWSGRLRGVAPALAKGWLRCGACPLLRPWQYQPHWDRTPTNHRITQAYVVASHANHNYHCK